jgi:hypothetical protein
MKTDKDLAIKLIDCIEDYYLRWTLMQTILDTSNVRGWRKDFDRLISDQEAREHVHRMFQPARDRIWDAPDLSEAVREMLKDIPGTGPKDSA